MQNRQTGVDPIQASVLHKRLEGITKEMATILMRSSRSPIFNEIGDLITAVFDATARTLAQTEYAAIIAFGAQPSLEHILEFFGSDIHEGDVIIHNDVYTGSNQFADVGIYVPVFVNSELVGFTVAKGHVADIGGSTLGGYNPKITEVWQEAFRIPPLKLFDRGVLKKDVWNLIKANIRLDIVAEDILAMVGACQIGRARFQATVEKLGTESFKIHSSHLLHASEQQVRREILQWPDGDYSGESFMVSDGFESTKKYGIRVTVRVRGDEITFDFTGTDPQAPGYTNMPYASALSAVRLTFMMLINSVMPEVPTNSGLFVPVHCVFPEGSLLNPCFPAATIFGNQMCDEVLESIMMALAPVLPDRVTAGWNQLICLSLAGVDPRTAKPFVTLTSFTKGGPGATKGCNGWDALGFTGTAGRMRSQDMEVFELNSPHVVESYEYLPDSAGAGQWRGGYGTRAVFAAYGESEFGVTIGDDCVQEGATPCPGLFGGKPGSLNRVSVTAPRGSEQLWGSKEMLNIPAGSVIDMSSGGGGGFGDPFLRPATEVAREVRDGLLSREKARTDYGVVVDTVTGEVDSVETETLRKGGAVTC